MSWLLFLLIHSLEPISRYLDFSVLIKNGCIFLELKPPKDLYECLDGFLYYIHLNKRTT